jgi:hypothetical protein
VHGGCTGHRGRGGAPLIKLTSKHGLVSVGERGSTEAACDRGLLARLLRKLPKHCATSTRTVTINWLLRGALSFEKAQLVLACYRTGLQADLMRPAQRSLQGGKAHAPYL